MPSERLEEVLRSDLDALERTGTRKGVETVLRGVVPPAHGKGPRYLLEGEGDRAFLRMNSNSYLGMSLREEVIAAEENAVRALGTGPGAVRFISGTWAPHVDLERAIATFHGREAAMIYSSAYAAIIGILPPLITQGTAVISDELNHSCIINAIRLARPREKYVYRHLDMNELETHLAAAAKSCQRAIVVTDGVFSMRGDYAPLRDIVALTRKYDPSFAENAFVVVDDSHGVGALGRTGRGTEEHTNCGGVDILVATLGKAIGVNGGYAVASRPIVDYLRETSPFYVYSNPITPGEAAAARKAFEILDSPQGLSLLEHLGAMTAQFEQGLIRLSFETIPGEHPIVPLMVRDAARTSAIATHLRKNQILATAINYPVVPRGDEEIRFQISADHTAADIDVALSVLENFSASSNSRA